MTRMVFTRSLVALLAGVLALTGCSSDDDAADSESTTSAASADSAPSADSESDQGDSTSSGYTIDDSGNGSVTVDGVVNEGFGGECEMSRGYGAEDVGDPSDEGIELLLVLDNIDEENPPDDPNAGMNFTITGSPETFRAANIGTGTVTSIEYLDGPSPLGDTTEIALIGVNGTTEDGAEVTAEVVCIIQNSYS